MLVHTHLALDCIIKRRWARGSSKITVRALVLCPILKLTVSTDYRRVSEFELIHRVGPAAGMSEADGDCSVALARSSSSPTCMRRLQETRLVSEILGTLTEKVNTTTGRLLDPKTENGENSSLLPTHCLPAAESRCGSLRTRRTISSYPSRASEGRYEGKSDTLLVPRQDGCDKRRHGREDNVSLTGGIVATLCFQGRTISSLRHELARQCTLPHSVIEAVVDRGPRVTGSPKCCFSAT